MRSQVDSRHGFGSPTNLSHRNATFFYEKRAELAFNKREKHSLHIACHMRFVFACFLGKFRLSDPSASLFEISPLSSYILPDMGHMAALSRPKGYFFKQTQYLTLPYLDPALITYIFRLTRD